MVCGGTCRLAQDIQIPQGGRKNEEYAERCIAGYLRSIESLAKHPTKGTITIKRENIRRLKLDRHNFVLYGVVGEGIEVKNILPYRLHKQRF
jgi:hypothetical protein